MPVKNQKYIQYYIESFDYSGSLMIILMMKIITLFFRTRIKNRLKDILN